MPFRRRIGMVFQKPNPFPTMSIYDNAVAGLKLNGVRDKKRLDELAERSLRMAFLWDEVKDDLKEAWHRLCPVGSNRGYASHVLSLCNLKLSLWMSPVQLLTRLRQPRLRSQLSRLKKEFTVIIVTHNLQQAARISDYTAFMYLGKLEEFGETATVFENPKSELTEKYITGKFG